VYLFVTKLIRDWQLTSASVAKSGFELMVELASVAKQATGMLTESLFRINLMTHSSKQPIVSQELWLCLIWLGRLLRFLPRIG
jgi:hypothetical protein